MSFIDKKKGWTNSISIPLPPPLEKKKKKNVFHSPPEQQNASLGTVIEERGNSAEEKRKRRNNTNLYFSSYAIPTSLTTSYRSEKDTESLRRKTTKKKLKANKTILLGHKKEKVNVTQN